MGCTITVQLDSRNYVKVAQSKDHISDWVTGDQGIPSNFSR